MKSRRQFIGAGVRLAVVAGLGASATLATSATLAASPALAGKREEDAKKRAATAQKSARQAPAKLVTTDLGGGFSLVAGAGCNVVALKGGEGALMVDGGLAAHAKALLAAVHKATGTRRVATLVNTHWHPAQTGANETVGKDGAVIVAHEVTRKYLARAVSSVDYDGLYGPLAKSGLPTQTTRDRGELSFAGQPAHYGYLPAAHTNGDLYVHFPEANLLVAGGPVGSEAWPMLDHRNGAWLGGLVRAHETLATLVQPDTRVIPAHGRPLTGAELRDHHRMYADFHERMVVFQNRGYDSGDCIAQKPLADFEPQFGDSAEFIRGAFRSLNLAYSPD